MLVGSDHRLLLRTAALPRVALLSIADTLTGSINTPVDEQIVAVTEFCDIPPAAMHKPKGGNASSQPRVDHRPANRVGDYRSARHSERDRLPSR
jgi:hypothetical protein